MTENNGACGGDDGGGASLDEEVRTGLSEKVTFQLRPA